MRHNTMIKVSESKLVPILSENTYPRRNKKSGLIEIVDMHTGEVLAVQFSHRDILQGKQDRFKEVQLPDGRKVLMEAGIGPRTLVTKSYLIDGTAQRLLADEIALGNSIPEACANLNLDYNEVLSFKRNNPDFASLLEQARKDRADTMHEMVLMEGRQAIDEKVRIETYKYMADKGNPESYGNRTKITGDKNSPLTFLLDTGIRRAGDPGYEEGKDAASNKVDTGESKKSMQDQPEDAVLVVEGGSQRCGVSEHEHPGENVEDISTGVDAPVREDSND